MSQNFKKILHFPKYGHYKVITKFAANLLFCCFVTGIILIGNCLINDEAKRSGSRRSGKTVVLFG